MTVNIPDDLATSISQLVQGGHYASVDEAVATAARLLLQQPVLTGIPPAQAQLFRRLIEAGLMTQVPNWEEDYDDPADQPIEIEGEPLSETIIRERR